MNDHSQLFRLLALLLDYPRAELREESLGLHALIRTCELPEALRDDLAALLNELCQGDLLDVQARYDGLFERGRSVSLLLFEHVHGESRDRGQAMVDLLDRYTGAGLQIDVPELPDYLPLYLEYLSLLPFAAASERSSPKWRTSSACWRCAWRNAAAPMRRFSRRCWNSAASARTSARCVATRPRNSATTAWRPSTGPGRKPR